MGRAEGSARDRPPAQAEPRLARMTVWPAALAGADQQDGGRRVGRRRNHRRRRRKRRPDFGRPGLASRRSKRDDLLPTPRRPGRRRRAHAPVLRTARQAQAVDLAQDGAAGDAGSQDIGDPGGRPAVLPEGSQLLSSLRCPDVGGHGGALDQQAQSARPRPPSFSPNHKEGPAFARRADGPMKIVDPFKTGYRRPGRSLPFPKSPHR